MNSLKALRLFVVLEWVLIVGSVVLSSLLEDSLPAPLREYVQSTADAEPTRAEWIMLAGLLPLLVVFVISSIGLLLGKGWARWTYLGVLLVGYPMAVLGGPTIEHAIPDMVADLSCIAAGIIVGIAFFSDALEAPPPENRLA